jgi:hypothetical protein
MAISYWIDTARDLLFTTATGVVNLENYLDYIQRLSKDAAYHWDMSGIFDATGATLDFSAEDAREIAELFGRQLPKGAYARRGSIVSRDEDFGIAAMFGSFVDDARLQFRIFRDRQQALEWLIGEGAAA